MGDILNLGLVSVSPRALAFLVAILVLNLFVLWVMKRASLSIELKEVIAEKDPEAVKARQELLNAYVDNLKQRAELKAKGVVEASSDPPKEPDPVPTSSSRVAGVLGALVLVAALWGLANFLVWASFWNQAVIEPALKHFGTFFLSGSALFAPYAFNQLGTMFRPNSR